MTLMGQKRDPDEPRKPMKRSAIRRKSPLRRSKVSSKPKTTRSTGNQGDEEYEAFMAQFRGLPCIVCGRTWFLRDENGNKILTAGHHMLYRSTHPHLKMEKKNVAPMCCEHHIPFAHEKPIEFMHWLHDNHPLIWQWVQENKHHRTKES